jgi:hypothetical protein
MVRKDNTHNTEKGIKANVVLSIRPDFYPTSHHPSLLILYVFVLSQTEKPATKGGANTFTTDYISESSLLKGQLYQF